MAEIPKTLILDDRELSRTVFSPVCAYCTHLISSSERKCLAFKNIPTEIWSGSITHRESYTGDGGFQFEFHSEVSKNEKARLQEGEAL